MRIWTLCFMLLWGLSLPLAVKSQAAPVSPEKLPPGSVLETNFVQYRHLNGIPKPIKSEGKIILWMGKGLIWTTHSPFPNSLLITPKGLYQLENETKTPIVKAGGNSALFEVMAGIFQMDMKPDVKGFTTERLSSDQDGWRIQLTPQHHQVSNFIQSIRIEGNTHIRHITISRPNGDRDEIDLKDHFLLEGAPPEMREWFNE